MSFRARLLLAMLAVTLVAQLAIGLAVLGTLKARTLDATEDDLRVAVDVTEQLIAERGEQLENNVGILASDFGFRSAVAAGEQTTLVTALANHGERAGANLVMLLSPEGEVLASSLHGEHATFPYAALWQRAQRDGSAVDIIVDHGEAYQVVMLPVRAPALIGWIGMGFVLGDALAQEASELTNTTTSFDVSGAAATPAAPSDAMVERRGVLYQGELGRAEVVARRSFQALMAPYYALRMQLGGIFAATLAFTALAAALVSRSISVPLLRLVSAAKSIGRGERLEPHRLPQSGEPGLLSRTLVGMQESLIAREGELRRQSLHDQLTGLGNRVRAIEDIETAIATGASFVLLRLTVNHMRRINDTFGYELGDQVLRTLAGRLADLPPPSRGAYRLNGDEFLLLLSACEGEPLWLDDTYRRLSRPMDLAGSTLTLTCALGEVRFPQHGRQASLLLRRAEIALETARRERVRHRCYLEGQDEHHLRSLALVRDLQHATERDELSLRYQPQIDATSGRVQTVEALMRWNHPRLGRVAPDEFIVLAERSGHMPSLTRWMLATACQQLAQWVEQGIDLRMAVNISALDLENETLAPIIARMLDRYGLDGERLCVEVTESAIMRSPEMATRVLMALRDRGVCVAVDDFGTGYSSLAQLKRLPVQELKIDKSFVLGLVPDSEDDVIVSSTIDLAHHLGLRTVAEGVESLAIGEHLTRIGCDLLQGYAYAAPMSATALGEWLARRPEVTSARENARHDP
ncbi:putative bifunctional diguanylate cyclase/phosphodiesterase [Halomonas sp. V046]|uniref:putative bifunctional diguanylate cyclase/phosphodiesterase n=1 Tax=Halomonas sp. V046 TaxID=3459611 RepID=UPI00404453B2